ncbi:A-kinase anchor protein 7 isoform X1 [Perca flavescens]|uniref:A-kinase anchor protein 7 isoform X1 n=1 Tax=Perca flavescens TaxID=8167 RepID=UPI00106E5833|nr:A-kinase anchoring protein 7 isoform X1 [Perca flavescens]
MLIGRVLLSPIRSTCSKIVCLQRVVAFTELSFRLHAISTSHCCNVSALKPSAHRSRLKEQSCLYKLYVCDMQQADISSGKETTANASDDDDEEEEGGGECVVVQESGAENKELKNQVMIPGQVDAVTMEVQQDPGASTVSAPAGSSEKKNKRKMRREKRKLMKKQLKSADTSDNFMSELPFSLTSPSTWKELGFSSPESIQKRKRKRGDIEGRVDSEEDAENKKKKKETKRPNYFISIPITNTQISSTVIAVQEAVLQQERRLAKAMIPVPTLHITLLVTHLASQEQVDLAATVLAQVEPSLAELLGGRDLVLPFSGISHFRKEVVFVGLTPGQHRHTLDSLAELLRSRFEEQGLLQEGNRGFEPHLTIMKLSRVSKLRSQGIKRVDPALYSNYTNKFFGDQTVERLDLCSMLKKKQQDGYYHTETSLQLDLNPLHAKRSSGRRRSEPDEAELLRVSRRLVEDAVNRALQQFKQETLQNGGGPNATALQPPGNTENTATKTDTTANSTTINRK